MFSCSSWRISSFVIASSMVYRAMIGYLAPRCSPRSTRSSMLGECTQKHGLEGLFTPVFCIKENLRPQGNPPRDGKQRIVGGKRTRTRTRKPRKSNETEMGMGAEKASSRGEVKGPSGMMPGWVVDGGWAQGGKAAPTLFLTVIKYIG